MENKELLHFLFELGQLRRVKHEGWRSVGVDFPESVAEHSFRAAQLAYFLALMENYERPHEVATMVLFHDIAEARCGDFHRLAKRYVEVDEARIVEEQCAPLGSFGEEIVKFWHEVETRSSPAGKIAKDADELEQALAAREYVELGHVDAKHWLDNVAEVLLTNSAKQLLEELRSTSSREWWRRLEQKL